MVQYYVLVVWIVKNEIKCKCQRYWLRNGQKCRYNRKKAMSSRTTATTLVQISEHLCVAMDLVKYSSTRIASFVSFKSEIATNDSKPRSSIEFHSASPEIKDDEKKNREQNGVKLSLEFVVFCIFLFFFFLAIVPKAHPTTAGNTKYASKAKSKRWRKRRKKKSRTRKEKKVSPKQKV